MGLTSHDPATLQPVGDIRSFPHSWLMHHAGCMYKDGKKMGRCPCFYLPVCPIYSIGLSWSPAGITRHRNRKVELTWGTEASRTGNWSMSGHVRPWDAVSPPTRPLWVVMDLEVVETALVLDYFPPGKRLHRS